MIVVLLVGAGVLLAWPARPRGPRRGRRTTAPATGAPSAGPRDRRLLLIGLLAFLAVAVSPFVGLLVLGAAYGRPRLAAHQEDRRRRAAVVDALPEAADLIAVAVAGGLSVPSALATAGRWTTGPVGEALRRAIDEIGLGRPVADALEGLAPVLGAPARPLVEVLVSSERYGVPLGESLDRLAREARLDRRRRAEARARRLPVLLLFPLVLCVLPAFGLLTVVPLLVGSLPELSP